ncbi:hypothetical protein Unana1_07899 [Umbelopsis nana]
MSHSKVMKEATKEETAPPEPQVTKKDLKGKKLQAKDDIESKQAESEQEAESEVSDVSDVEEEEAEDKEAEDKEAELYEKLVGLRVNKSYDVLDANDNVVGKVANGDRKKAVGRRVKEGGVILDSKGNFIAGVVPVPPPQGLPEQEAESEVSDVSDVEEEEAKDEEAELYEKLVGLRVNKSYDVLDANDKVVGKVANGDRKKAVGRRVQEGGVILDSKGNFIAGVVPVPPPQGLPEDSPTVDESGKILSETGEVVGKLKRGNRHELAGMQVDEDGNVIDAEGNVRGEAELLPTGPPEKTEEEKKAEAEEQEARKITDQMSSSIEQALSRIKPILKIITELIEAEERKPENDRDEEGLVNSVPPLIEEGSNILGEVNGTIRALDPTGKIAKTAQVKYAERNASPEEYRLAELLSQLTDEVTTTIENAKKKIAALPQEARKIADQMSSSIEQALSRIKPILKIITELFEAEERKPENDRDEEGLVKSVPPLIEEGSNILGEVNGTIRALDPTGKIARTAQVKSAERKASPEEYRLAELLSQLTDEVTTTIENAKKKIAALPQEARKIADQMSAIIEQALSRIKPILKMITELIEAEERKPEKERDEEGLVNAVRPLIEEGSNILGEVNGAIRGLDPTGKIAKTAQAKSAERKASPEEYRLAELLSQLTGEVTTTIENAKKKIAGMPKAEEALNPLWALLQEPLVQILAAVGLLLSGVLGLVGKLLNGLGLGGIVNNILGGLGLNKVFESLGVGKILGGGKLLGGGLLSGGGKKKK